MKALVQRDVMKVVSSHVTAHRSQNEPSNVRDGDCRDGNKLLCNNGKGETRQGEKNKVCRRKGGTRAARKIREKCSE